MISPISEWLQRHYTNSVGTLQSCRNNGNSGLCPDYGHVSFRSVSKGFKVDVGLLRGGSFCSRKRSSCVIQASASQATVADEASAPSSATTSDSNKKTSMIVHLLNCYFQNNHTHSIR